MLCPKCSSEVRKSGTGACPECKYRFGLDPSEPHGLSDAEYLSLVDRASFGGQYCFTQNQLHFYYCADRMPSGIMWPLAGIIGGALGSMALDLQAGAMAAITAAGLVHYGTKAWRPPSRTILDGLHESMKTAGHPIRRFIARPLFEFRDESKYIEQLPNASQIERVIVVDRDPLVDLLVLNGFPKRAKALVVSQAGYPNYVVPIVTEILAKRRSLAIYLLHDSTESRVAMNHRITESDLLPIAGHPLYNLGLEPEQVAFMNRLAPIQPARSSYQIPIDSIPYPYLDAALTYALRQSTPLLTGFAATGFVEKR